mmetsp:Transcript_14192/g.24092  ORF Transcript_14192/g.24092 Transcript_14192/m.24092 type:complete len:81 (-) Transcript_14192:61-303(-)
MTVSSSIDESPTRFLSKRDDVVLSLYTNDTIFLKRERRLFKTLVEEEESDRGERGRAKIVGWMKTSNRHICLSQVCGSDF